MEIKVKTYYTDSFDIMNNIKNSVYKLTGYISRCFRELESMRNVDRLLQDLLEVTIMDPFDYVVEFEITNTEGSSLPSTILDKLNENSDIINYVDNSFERTTIAEYELTYKDVKFLILTDFKKGLILSVEDKILQEIADKLM